MPDGAPGGGTGSKLTSATVIVAGVASLVATLISFISVWLQTKNYRKPLLQRYVIRILFMVPIYAASSWASIMSLKAALYLDPIRDIYEAFTIYTFLQLLVNFLGGERALIIMMHGRQPVHHAWPLNHCLAKVDISDPHTFLAIKRGILQYAWLKPILSLVTIIMKSTDTYQEGYLGLTSGYLWTGILYNLSVTLCLYSLAMFWVCMSQDLQPFRPMPKFLCIKLIIFASYWQGFGLSILQWLGAIPNDVPGYTPDNLAAAIQDALICFEMPIFAISHWYAFSWHDYADITISAARMPVKYALRDAFGIRDLIEDTKETFNGKHYEYRVFDTGDNVLAHEESDSRAARMMEGMRYERGGKGKYWIPDPGEVNSRTPLLGNTGPSRAEATKTNGTMDGEGESGDVEEAVIDPEDERLFANARVLEFGDWNYPVITAHQPSGERWLHADPSLITTSTNRNILQPTKGNKKRREAKIKKSLDKGKHRSRSGSNGSESRAPALDGLLHRGSSSAESKKSGHSQLVDLVVQDTGAEEIERVRARKEGGAAWNQDEPKHFVKTYEDEGHAETVRQGFEPTAGPTLEVSDFTIGNDDEDDGDAEASTHDESDEARQWKEGHDPQASPTPKSPTYGDLHEEQQVWGAETNVNKTANGI